MNRFGQCSFKARKQQNNIQKGCHPGVQCSFRRKYIVKLRRLKLNYKVLMLIVKNKISFTLYPAYIRVGTENLVLRHSVPHFPPNFSRRCVSSDGTQRWAFALLSERINENIKK